LDLFVKWIVNPNLELLRAETRVSASSVADTRAGAIAADDATQPRIESAIASAHRKSQNRMPRGRGRYKGG
jgi:hypothetical protein